MMTTDTLILGDLNTLHPAWYLSSTDTTNRLMKCTNIGSLRMQTFNKEKEVIEVKRKGGDSWATVSRKLKSQPGAKLKAG